MANVQITRHIVVNGDLGLKTAAIPLYALVGGKIQWNVSVGEPVAYLTDKTGRIPVTTSTATIDDTNKHRVRFGVGHSTGFNGVVDSIRHAGSEEMGNCDIEAMSVASPTCGNAEVKDLYFDCVNCDDAYTVELGVRDNFTQSYAPKMKDYANWYASYTPNCKNCNDCDGTTTCDEVVDGLMDNLLQPNGRTLPNGKPYPDYVHPKDDFPFDVHKVYTRSLVYCLSFEAPASECVSCNQLTAFDNVTIGGVAIDLTGVVTPTDNTAIFRSQLEQVTAIINDAIAADDAVNGRAYITGVNYNTCCPLQLHINTDDATLAIVDNALATLVPIETNPFDVGQPGEGFTCGIRIIAAPLSGSCETLITKPLAMYGRKVSIRAIGDGFKDSREADIQKMEFPGQFGTLIQYQELTQDRGGSGRGYSGGNQVGTWLGGPRADSKVRNAITAKCGADYCSYYVRSRVHFINQFDQQDSKIMDSFVHVESDATTANAEIKAFLDKLASLSTACRDVPEIQCTPLATTC